MLYNKIKKLIQENKYTIGLLLSLFFYTTDAFAVFEALGAAGEKIFYGLRGIIYPAATIGVACVCIAGMFGSFNWKWFFAILIGVFVIAFASEVGDLATKDVADMSGKG